MKRIVFVIEQLYGGGAERVTAALMNALCQDYEVHLISTYCYDHEKDYSTDSRIIKHSCNVYSKMHAVTLMKRIAFLRRNILDLDPICVISLAGCGTNALLTAAMLGTHIPLILSERNDPVHFPASKIERILRNICYRFCSGLVFQTRVAQSYFPDRIQRNSVIICNPITDHLPDRYEGVRERRIVNCCRLSPQKNLDLLVDAFSDIAGEFPDMILEIYGEGAERQRLEKRISEMGLSDRIYLPGYAFHAFEKMWKASMFVSSSDYEGISNSMLEALALGVPTICTDCSGGSASDVIQNGVNGLLVPVRDRRAMAEAMRKLLRDSELMENISRNGCMLRDSISVEKIAEKWQAYIEQICSIQHRI